MHTGNGYSDAARRCADIITQAFLDGCTGWWVAIRLSDGGSDGVLYASRAAAIAYQLHETQCCYVQVILGGMTPKEAEAFLSFNRTVYDQGYRMTDPDAPEPVRPLNLY